MIARSNSRNLQRDTLRKLQATNKNQLIPLRLEYSILNKLLTGYVNGLMGVNRIYPRILPTQASHRSSTLDPPVTNFPRDCINPQCPSYEHEWDNQCWSMRDIISHDVATEVLASWDHDNIEGRVGDLILNDKENLEAYAKRYDLHTINCCNIFGYALPKNLVDPHNSPEDQGWREKYKWRGKDTTQRVLAKNFSHGSRYSNTPKFVYTIKNIEQYGISYPDLLKLAKRYIASKKQVFQNKKDLMDHIRRVRAAKTLYGSTRYFFNSSAETGKEGFAYMVSGTVSLYNNMTLIMIEKEYGEYCRLLHNAHDGDKVAFSRGMPHFDAVALKRELSKIIQRDVTYQGRSITLTAGVKIYG